MNRRTFLVGTVGSLTLVSGCIGSNPTPESADNATSESSKAPTQQPTPNTVEPPLTETTEATSPGVTQVSPTRTFTHSVRDIRIYNETNTAVRITVTISRLPISWGRKTPDGTERQNYPSSEQTLSETFELPPSTPPEYKSKDYQNPFKSEKIYSIKLSVHNGPTNTYRFGEYGDDEGLLIYIRENSIEFGQIIA